MRKILLSPLAAHDPTDIWQYSFGQWGETQADQYLDDLYEGFQCLNVASKHRGDFCDAFRIEPVDCQQFSGALRAGVAEQADYIPAPSRHAGSRSMARASGSDWPSIMRRFSKRL